MRVKTSLAIIACLFMTWGCTTIQSVSISEMAKGPGHRVKAEDKGHGFFMLSLPRLDVAAKLKAQCAGAVTGIQTTTRFRNWLVVQHYAQEAEGWCQ